MKKFFTILTIVIASLVCSAQEYQTYDYDYPNYTAMIYRFHHNNYAYGFSYYSYVYSYNWHLCSVGPFDVYWVTHYYYHPCYGYHYYWNYWYRWDYHHLYYWNYYHHNDWYYYVYNNYHGDHCDHTFYGHRTSTLSNATFNQSNNNQIKPIDRPWYNDNQTKPAFNQVPIYQKPTVNQAIEYTKPTINHNKPTNNNQRTPINYTNPTNNIRLTYNTSQSTYNRTIDNTSQFKRRP